MSKICLITGGTGFIGSALVRRLIKEGSQVRVLDNDSRGSIRRLEDLEGDFDFIEGDIRDAEAVKAAVKGVDAVCHLAAINGTEFFYTKPEEVLEVGVKGIVNVIDACIDFQVSELVFASSSEVYQTPPTCPTDERVPLAIPDPLNPRYSYAATKIISEMMVLNYGRKHIGKTLIIRPHNVYGPDMGEEHVIPQFVLRMRRLCRQSDGPVAFPIQGTGKETRAFVFIEDFIDGLMLVMDRGENMGIYNIGTMEEITIAEVAILIASYFGREIEIVPGRPADGATFRRCPDITKLTELGYKPTCSLKDGVLVTAKWYDENADTQS